MKKIIIARSVLDQLSGRDILFRRGTVSTLVGETSEDILNLHGVHRADLIITEAGLPLMGGARLCSLLRDDQELKKVSIILVCEGDRGSAEECGRALANAVVSKPIDPFDLFAKVSELLVIPARKDIRVVLREAVKGTAEKGGFLGLAQNISISGMLIETDRGLHPGDRFTCLFDIGRREIRAECLVVRAVPAGGRLRCGVNFVNLDTKSLIIIEQYVKAGKR